MKALIKALTPKKINYEKLRFGCNSDGGYVLFNYALDKLERIYSYGIGNEISFENDLMKISQPSCINYLYDHTIECPPPLFDKQRMRWYKQSGSELHIPVQLEHNKDLTHNYMLLKMDIECDEWRILKSIDFSIIEKFYQLIIEFHFVHEADINVFDKLNSSFYLGHIHGNNCAGIKDGIPEVVECTYIRKDCLTIAPEIDFSRYPIEQVDFPNKAGVPDYSLNYWI